MVPHAGKGVRPVGLGRGTVAGLPVPCLVGFLRVGMLGSRPGPLPAGCSLK